MVDLAAAPPGSAPPPREAVYQRVCESYQAVDDFRMKLLGLLPVATGTGVFLLLSGKIELIGSDAAGVRQALGAIGLFGLLFTLGLYAYEIFGIKKCHYLMRTGRHLEALLGVEGQFTSRPRSAGNVLNEPFASAVIYPACMAAWVFVAETFTNEERARILAAVVFVAGFAATLLGVARIGANERLESRALPLMRGPDAVARPVLIDALASGGERRGPAWLRRLDARRTVRRLERRSGEGAGGTMPIA